MVFRRVRSGTQAGHASRIRGSCARLTPCNHGHYGHPIMGLRGLIVLLLSATLVGVPAMRPVVAMTMGMQAGAANPLSCDPHGRGATLPASCARSFACIAMDEVRPSAGRLARSAHTAPALFRWQAPVWHGADVAPETGPPRRPA